MPPPSPDWQRPRTPDTLPVSALSQAIDLAQAPRLAAHMRRRPLPRDVLSLIRLASGGDPELAAAAAATTPRDPGYVIAAAELYLRQVVCFPGADPYRTLGVSRRASRTQMRQHMRELVLWLHPDRKGTAWDAAMMQRVMEAWHSVSGSAPGPSEPPHVSLAVPPRAGRARRPATFRPTWISQPLPKARRRPMRRGLPAALRASVVIVAMVVPEFAVLSPPSHVDGPERTAEQRGAATAAQPPHSEPSPPRRSDSD